MLEKNSKSLEKKKSTDSDATILRKYFSDTILLHILLQLNS